jgi:phosphoenolpyruvate carboxykinase (GTP)
MLPFCGYNMSDYFGHWLALGSSLADGGARLPRIFCVNWFRKDAQGRFVWPGFGENMRVLAWMLGRIESDAQGEEHALGVSPRYGDLSWDGLEFSPAQFMTVIALERQAWEEELSLHAELFEQLGTRLPRELHETRTLIAARLRA